MSQNLVYLLWIGFVLVRLHHLVYECVEGFGFVCLVVCDLFGVVG